MADLRKVTTEEKRLTLIVRLAHTVRAGVRDDGYATVREFRQRSAPFPSHPVSAQSWPTRARARHLFRQIR